MVWGDLSHRWYECTCIGGGYVNTAVEVGYQVRLVCSHRTLRVRAMYTYQRQCLRKQEMCVLGEDKQDGEGGRGSYTRGIIWIIPNRS